MRVFRARGLYASGALDDLAIELEDEAQYAMGRRVLRPEIDGEVAQRSLAHGGPPFGAPARQ